VGLGAKWKQMRLICETILLKWFPKNSRQSANGLAACGGAGPDNQPYML
jgi:hypothetical protein